MAKEDQISIEIVLENGSIIKGFQKIERKAKSSGEKSGDNFESGFEKGLGSLRSKVVGFAAGLGAAFAFKALAKASEEFGTALAEISTITDDLSVSNGELANSLIGLSAQFGGTAAGQAKAFYQIISAGAENTAVAIETLTAANKLAIGGLTTTAGAADLLTSAMKAFESTNLSAARAADIIFGTVKLGKTNVEQLQSSLGLILPTAQSLGVSFEDVAGAIAKITQKGLSSSLAVTQLNAVFTAVLSKQETAKSLGPKVAAAFTLQALRAKGLTTFLKDLNGALGGSNVKLTKLIGSAEGAKAIINLGSDGFKGLADNVRELETASGAANAAFEKIAQTTAQRTNVAVAKTQAIFLKLAGTTGGPLNSALTFLNEQLDDVLSAFQSIPTFGALVEGTLLNIGINALIALKSLGSLATTLLSFIPALANVAKGMRAAFGSDIASGIDAVIAKLEAKIASLAGKGEDAVSASALSAADKVIATSTKLQETVATSLGGTLGIIGSFASAGVDLITGFFENFTDEFKFSAAEIASLSKTIGNSFANGISKGIQTVIGAVMDGKDAFAALGGAILGIIGDLAISVGQFVVATGIAKIALESFPGGAAIAAGVGLIAVGTILKMTAGGSSPISSGGAVSSGSSNVDVPTGPDLTESVIDEDTLLNQQSAVVVNLQGIVTNPVETAQQIADLLLEVSDSNDIKVFA